MPCQQEHLFECNDFYSSSAEAYCCCWSSRDKRELKVAKEITNYNNYNKIIINKGPTSTTSKGK
jgi:hypothetical protein